jgi:hypothetical protein
MSAARGVSVAAALIAGAGVVAGCGSSPGSEDSAAASHKLGQANVSAELLYQSPAQATLSWFFAINRKDKAAVLAHFDRAVPSVHGQLAAWASSKPSRWSTFSALHCRQISRNATTASVRCTFKESWSPYEGNPDSWWTVYLDRQPDGRWLITGYGQP